MGRAFGDAVGGMVSAGLDVEVRVTPNMPKTARQAVAQNGRDGLTLVETTTALLILALSIAGLCSLVMLARESSDRSRSHYTAVNIAKNRIERASVFAFSELDSLAESYVSVDTSGTPYPSGDYRRTTVFSNVTSRLKAMTVTVEIRDRISRLFGRERETLCTYVTDFKGRL
jgi:hypothetical protein